MSSGETLILKMDPPEPMQSAVNFEVPSRGLGAREVLRLPLADDEGGNLLQHLPVSFGFIHAALQQVRGAHAFFIMFQVLFCTTRVACKLIVFMHTVVIVQA